MTPDQIADLRRQKYNATVVHLRKPNPDLMIVRVRPDFPRPLHKPGQYALLGLGFWEPRFPGSQEENLARPTMRNWPAAPTPSAARCWTTTAT
jgi:ferredoxin--NADP+ reductase